MHDGTVHVRKNICHENSLSEMYSKDLRAKKNPSFDTIRELSVSYRKKYFSNVEISYNLKRGTKILDKEAELYEYMLAYVKKHKAKLYESFDTIIHQLNNQTINIIDWGCGQAVATSVLIDYIKENKFNIDISNITLIEPSSLALSRGMLHIDVLKENEIEVKPINKDIDSLDESDLVINNTNTTLHLFSNILDMEAFKLDKLFLEKIFNSQNSLNYFVCISPNINDKANDRLDMFYRYFNDNFETDLISKRNDEIYTGCTRYEIIFFSLIENPMNLSSMVA